MNILFLLLCILLIPLGGGIGLIVKLLLWSFILFVLVRKFICNHFEIRCNLYLVFSICLLLGWMFIRSQNLFGFKLFAQFAFLMILFLADIKFTSINRNLLAFFYCVVIVLFILFYFGGNAYTNTNLAGIVTLIISFFVYVYFPLFRFYLLPLSLIAVYGYDSRSIILSLIISIVLLYSLKRHVISVGKMMILFAIVVGGGIYLLWDYIWSPEFNLLVFEYTHKNFQSGRQEIWGAVFSSMHGVDWIIGKGGGIKHGTLVPITYEDMSLHSSYVFMIFHYGIIGLFLFFVVICKSLNRLVNSKYYYSAALFLFFVIRDFFEVTIVNNQMAIAFFVWSFLGNGGIERNKAYFFGKQKDVLNTKDYQT